MTTDVQQQTEFFGILELFGHQRIAGRISEQVFGGQTFVRVDVPAVERVIRTGHPGPEDTETIAAHTRSFGAGAIYAINWCDADAAHLAAASIQHRPIQPYGLQDALETLPAEHRARLLTRARGDADDIAY